MLFFFVLRTGCQRNALPRSLGASSTGGKAGVFKRMWIDELAMYDKKTGIDWKWQAMDGVITKAPLRGKKQCLLVLIHSLVLDNLKLT